LLIRCDPILRAVEIHKAVINALLEDVKDKDAIPKEVRQTVQATSRLICQHFIDWMGASEEECRADEDAEEGEEKFGAGAFREKVMERLVELRRDVKKWRGEVMKATLSPPKLPLFKEADDSDL
jgi:broad specificity phosphatase PhoE